MSFINMLELVYPVGSIYISINNMSPAEIVGGTWQKIENQFLYGTSENSNTYGGNAIHKHTLSLRYAGYYRTLASMTNLTQDYDNLFSFYNEETGEYTTINDLSYPATTQTVAVNSAIAKSRVESSSRIYQLDTTLQASNLPAYYAVYMWVRIA